MLAERERRGIRGLEVSFAGPRSRSRTFFLGEALRRNARTQPAVPPEKGVSGGE